MKKSENHEELKLGGVGLFSDSSQKADVKQSYDKIEKDERDEYWRKNFINYDGWKKEDHVIAKNKKI